MAVIDASVYVALVNEQEDAHEASISWFHKAVLSGESMVAPVIILAEVAAAISRGVGNPVLAHRTISQLQNSRIIRLQQVSAELGARAAAIAADYKIRGCDSIYVALAEQMGSVLVTLDGQQLERGTEVIEVRVPW